MSSYLSNQLRSFQGDVASAGSKLSQKRTIGQAANTSRPSPTPSTSLHNLKPGTAATGAGDKRKRPETNSPAPTPLNVVYSQPLDTGTGKHLLTQVTYAVEYLKSKDKPIGFSDIYNYLSVQDADEHSRRRLEKVLKEHPKVDYDASGLGGRGSYRFRPVHNVRSADELLAFLQRQPTAQGVQVKELKDGWPSALDTVEALEKEGRLLVTRNKKDGTPRMVWSNDPTLSHPVDKEFQDLWHKVKVPVEAEDMRKELVEFGLTPTSQVRDAGLKGKAKEKKKRAARRGGKTTNTHMAAILKDYSHTRPVK